MSSNDKAKSNAGLLHSHKKRFPTLMAGLIILMVAVTLIGGKTIIFSALDNNDDSFNGSISDSESSNNTNKNVGIAVDKTNSVKIKDGVQYVTSSMTSGSYDSITVQQRIPVKWTINVPSQTLNGCNRSIVIPEYNVKLELKAGDNLIEFTPDKAGTFSFSCWMGMIRSTISVVGEDGTTPPAQNDDSSVQTSGGCCGGGFAPAFANGKIPTDNIQLAKVVNGVQQATVKVDSYGYSPAVIVIERNKKFVINFDVTDINGCNGTIYFPDYGGGIDLSKEKATPELTADDDFSFECSMGMLHGYVKVVDDLNNVDLEAVKIDVENFVPSDGGGGCCS